MTKKRNFNFTRLERIHLQREIEQIFKLGRRYRGLYFSLVCLAGGGRPYSRIGILFAHAFKGAVARNRLKRMIREIFRTEKHRIETPCDLIFYFKPLQKDFNTLSLNDLKTDFLELFHKAGVCGTSIA